MVKDLGNVGRDGRTGSTEELERRIIELEGEIARLMEDNRGLEAENESLLAQVDRYERLTGWD